ncbi:hypothetical protein LTR85_012265 [Meristemomyces frigidus]|nr:hypothetical protein LTR85_012265 [Meristemomyces frigidus]
MEATQASLLAKEYALGIGRVKLSQLRFEPGVRDTDEKNVERLRLVFHTEGCHREDPTNFIPALVSKDDLGPAWVGSDKPQDLQLPAGQALHCLHGKHRVLAARRILRANDQWWTVTLYGNHMPNDVRQSLVEEYKNERQFADGDIFRYYRDAQIRNDQRSVKRWLARLSACKRRNLMQLEKADHGRVIEALDNLLPYTGLWQQLQLGALNRLLPLRLWQEILTYLRRMLHCWKHIMEDLEPSALTPQSVEALQLRMPLLSRSDEDTISVALKLSQYHPGGVAHYKAFPAVSEPGARQRLMERIYAYPRIISFRSFLEDTIYLEVCHNSMRCLLPNRQAYCDSFEAAFRSAFGGDEACFPTCYLQLWLYSMRHFPELSDIAASQPRKEKGGPKPTRKEVSSERQDAFAAFATALGFEVRNSSDRVDSQDAPIPDISPLMETPNASTDMVDIPIGARCNRPFERNFRTGRKFLFIQHIYAVHSVSNRHEYITAFAVAQDLIHSFWGERFAPKWPDGGQHQTAHIPRLNAEAIVPPPASPTMFDNASIDRIDGGPNQEAERSSIQPDADFIARVNPVSAPRDSASGGGADPNDDAEHLPDAWTQVQVSSPDLHDQDAHHSDPTYGAVQRQALEEGLYEDTTPPDAGAVPMIDDTGLSITQRAHSDRKRRRDPVPEVGRDLTTTERAREALDKVGPEKCWCVVEPGGECFTVEQGDQQRLDALLDQHAKPGCYLRKYTNSDNASIPIHRGEGSATISRGLSQEKPYGILIVSRQTRASRRQVPQWDLLPIRALEGDVQVSTFAFEKTGNTTRRRLWLEDGDRNVVYEKYIRKSQSGSDAEYELSNTDASGDLLVELRGKEDSGVPFIIKFLCRQEGWNTFCADKQDFLPEVHEEL